MITFLRGKLSISKPTEIAIDVADVGYQVFISARDYHNLPAVGSALTLHTAHIIRENSQSLYGFLNPQERDLFFVLINISGIGPKLALSLISHLSVEQLQQAITSRNYHTINKVPGIGKRTAEKLIIELHDKLPALFPAAGSTESESETTIIRDAVNALTHLGYKENHALQAVKTVLSEAGKEYDLPELITVSLQRL